MDVTASATKLKKRCSTGDALPTSDEGKRRRYLEESPPKCGRGGGIVMSTDPPTPIQVRPLKKPAKGRNYSNFIMSRAHYGHLLAQIIPVHNAKAMSDECIMETYRLEHEATYFTHQETKKIEHQVSTFAARKSIVFWMSQCASALEWSIPSLFAGIASLDLYCAKTKHAIRLEDLGRVGATCLYYAGHMQETTVDDTIKSLEKFGQLCQEVGNPATFLNHQIHLVDTLQGMNLCRKTPFDFLMLYLARLQFSSGIFGEALFRLILGECQLAILMEVMQCSNVNYYTSALSIYIRGSVWVSIGLFHILCRLTSARDYLASIGMKGETMDRFQPEQLEQMKTNIISKVIHSTCLVVPNGDVEDDCIENILPSNESEWLISEPEFYELFRMTEKMYSLIINLVKNVSPKREVSNKLLQPMLYKKSLLTYKSEGAYLVPTVDSSNDTEINIGLTRPQVLWIHKHPGNLLAQIEPALYDHSKKLKSYLVANLERKSGSTTSAKKDAEGAVSRGSISDGFVLPKLSKPLPCGAPQRRDLNS